MESLLETLLQHGPWAAFAGLLFFTYNRLVNSIIEVIHANTEAGTKTAEAIQQVTQVMIEVKDAVRDCNRKP